MKVAQYAGQRVVDVVFKFVGLLLYVCKVVVFAVYADEANNAAYLVVIQIEVTLTAAAALYSPGTKETPVYSRASVGKAYQSAGVLAPGVGYDAVKNSYKEVVISGFLFHLYGLRGKDNLSAPARGGTFGVNEVGGRRIKPGIGRRR